jgi:hypothetical protein
MRLQIKDNGSAALPQPHEGQVACVNERLGVMMLFEEGADLQKIDISEVVRRRHEFPLPCDWHALCSLKAVRHAVGDRVRWLARGALAQLCAPLVGPHMRFLVVRIAHQVDAHAACTCLNDVASKGGPRVFRHTHLRFPQSIAVACDVHSEARADRALGQHRVEDRQQGVGKGGAIDWVGDPLREDMPVNAHALR